MSRECTCYCQLCACKEFAKVLAEKCVLKCPVCQREADRIVVKDAADDQRVPALRRCKSVATVREKQEKISDVHRAVVSVQRESSSQTVAEGGQNTQKDLAVSRYIETMYAIRTLLEETPTLQKAEIILRQEPPSQKAAENRQHTQRSLRLLRYIKALSACKKLFDAITNFCGGGVQLPLKLSNQIVEEGKQNAQTYSITPPFEEGRNIVMEGGRNIVMEGGRNIVMEGGRNIVMEGGRNIVMEGGRNIVMEGGRNIVMEGGRNIVMEGGRNIVMEGGRNIAMGGGEAADLSNNYKTEIPNQKASASQTVEDKQNAQAYSVTGLCDEAMSSLEDMAGVLLGNCDAEFPGHPESTRQKVAEGKQNTQNGGLPKGTYEKTEAAFDKLFDVICNFIAVETPVQQAASDQTVVEGAWTLRQVPLLHRCESATFSWDKQCPICQTTPDIDHESK